MVVLWVRRLICGPMEMIRTGIEYKEFDGELIAVHYVDDVGGMQEVIRTVTKVSFDAIPDTTFDLPKELVK